MSTLSRNIGFLFLIFTANLFAQQTQFVDFKTIHAAIEIDPAKRTVIGKGTYTFEVTEKIDTIRIDAKNMQFDNVKINNGNVKFIVTEKELLLYKGFGRGDYTLTFDYFALPSKGMYFVNWDFSNQFIRINDLNGQVWTDDDKTSHWLPSFDDNNEKTIVSLDITFPNSFNVISNGVLINKYKVKESLEWQYRMIQPVSSSFISISIGRYKKQAYTSANNTPFELYYEKKDSLKFEPTYRYSKEIFDFYNSEIGVPYPWGIYRQIPMNDFVQDGVGKATHTSFSRNFVVDSIGFVDENYITINSKELARQWFGILVTPKTNQDRWLQEGFKTYYSLLAEKQIFGEDYFYYKLYQYYEKLKEIPADKNFPLLNEKASLEIVSLKGALALHYIRTFIGGEKFNLAIKEYLESYAYKSVTTDDFMEEINKVSNFYGQIFKKTWLEQTIFPENDFLKSIESNEFINQYIQYIQKPLYLVKDKEIIEKIVQDKSVYYPIKALFLFQSISQPFDKKEFLLKESLKTNDIYVRQAVASSLKSIPESFREEYETLLNDKSYKTQEIALMNLWQQFPEHRLRYVELSENWEGFNNKNLKFKHLFLAYLTSPDESKKFKVYHQLLDYTSVTNESSIRQEALKQLLALGFHSDAILKYLVYGTCSHNKKFNNFSKNTIRELLKSESYKQQFIKIRAELPEREKAQLQRLLSEL
ncbi:MAG TPA: M1 family aminopeptidase [Flavobacterium sp.]|nr:M1 family aminopeptidase [Flavobacterium sp.]